LKNAVPETPVNRGVLLTLDTPAVPKPPVSADVLAAFNARVKEVVDQAGKGFAGIEGLTVHNLMASGFASITGTAEAIVKEIELDYVETGMMGDRKVTRSGGATR